MITIGVTGVGGGVGQSILRAIMYNNLQSRTIGMDMRAMNSGMYWTDRAYLVPPVAREEEYIQRLLDICVREQMDVLIPGLDFELAPLARHRQRFLEQGCVVIVGSPEAVRLSADKRAMYEFARVRGLPFVTTYTLVEAQNLVSELEFPVIAKPRAGSASVGARLLHTAEDLLGIPASEDLIVQTYLPPVIAGVANEDTRSWGGRLNQINEISAQFFVDRTGTILGDFVSVNRLKDGVPVEVVPDPHSPALRDGLPLVEALAAEGLCGPINLQGRLTPHGVKFFEINARFTGITGVRAAMGFREVEAAIRSFALQQDAEQVCGCLAYSPHFIGTRHVDECITLAKRVEAVCEDSDFGAGRTASLAGRVLVTGASGYVGANVIGHLLDSPAITEVVAAVRDEAAGTRLREVYGATRRLNVVYGDLPDVPWSLEGITTVIHAAGIRTSLADDGRFMLINTEGTRRLLAAARRANVARFIYLSTQAIYGTGRRPLWSEGLPAQPETPYALSKWAGELLCMQDSSDRMQTVVLRVARVYGLGHCMRWAELPHQFADRAAQGQPLQLHAGGHERVDMVHLQDLCDAILRACALPLPKAQRVILNIGGGHPFTVAELASICQAAAIEVGLPAPAIVATSGPNGRLREFGMDIRRARTQLGWSPAVSLKAGFCSLIEAAVMQDVQENLVALSLG